MGNANSAGFVRAREFALVHYTGQVTDAINRVANLALWDFLKTNADGSRNVVGAQLTHEQMDTLIEN